MRLISCADVVCLFVFFLEFLGFSNSQDDETPAKKKAAQGGGDEMSHKQRSKHFGGDGSQEEV